LGFIFEVVIDIITNAVGGVMGFFVEDFWADLAIADVNASTGMLKTKMMFDKYLPGAGGEDMRMIFKTMGYTIVFLLLFLNLAKAFLPQEASQSIQHPFESIMRGAAGAFAVLNAYIIVAVIQKPMAIMFDCIYNAAEKSDVMQSEIGTVKSPMMVELPLSDQVDTLVGGLITMFIVIALAWGFITLIAEIIERYVIMCFLFYVAPLPFAGLASNTTQNITTSYLRMIFSQYLLMMFNLCFVYVFCYAYVNQNTEFESVQQAIIFYLVLLSWLKLGKSLDEHMRTLGLSAAQTGRGLLAEAAIAGSAALRGAQMLHKGLKGSYNFGKKAISNTMDSRATAQAGTPAGMAAAAMAAATAGNVAAGNSAMSAMNPALAQAVREGRLTDIGAMHAASQLAGIPLDQMTSASIPKNFATEGMTVTDGNGSASQIVPVGGTDPASFSAAGIPESVACTTFDHNGNTFAMYPLDAHPEAGGIMAEKIGHDQLGSSLGCSGDDSFGVGGYNATLDSSMASKFGLSEGNYIAADSRLWNFPEDVTVHHRDVRGNDIGFINVDTFKGAQVQQKGWAATVSSGAGKAGAYAGV